MSATPTPRATSSPAPLADTFLLGPGGAGSTLLRSADGGLTWDLGTDSESSLRAIAFVDRRRGWAVGVQEVLRTVDGGVTWVSQNATIAGGPGILNDVAVAAPSRVVAVGSERVMSPDFSGPPLIFLTEDGGDTWVRAEIEEGTNPALANSSLLSVCLTPQGSGIALGSGVSGGILLLTDDGGATWRDVRERVPDTGDRVSCVGDATLWLLRTEPVLLLKSDDGGVTWVDRSRELPPDLARISAMHFLDPLGGWLVARDQDGMTIVLHTMDAGASWEPQLLPAGPITDLTTISFGTASRGIIGGSEQMSPSGVRTPRAFVTDDGGASWIPSSLPEIIKIAVLDVTSLP